VNLKHVDWLLFFSGLNLMMMLLHVLQQVMRWKEILVEHKMMMEVCIIHQLICWFISVKIVKVSWDLNDDGKRILLLGDVLCDVNQEDIPENLITKFDYDK
jgi:hypothetical protein